MIASDFHKVVIELQLESVMLTVQQFTETFGALNWKASTAMESLANVTGRHPLKLVMTKLAAWLGDYEQGVATVDDWQTIMDASSYFQWVADVRIHEASNQNNPNWQTSKAAARETIRRESDSQRASA